MAVVVEFDSNDVVAVANAAELVFTGGTAITANGSQIVLLGVRELIVNLLANVKSLGAGATIVFSIQEIDPIDAANAIATVLASQPKVSTGVFSAVGTDSASLPTTIGTAFQVSWVVTGSPACAVNLTIVGKVN